MFKVFDYVIFVNIILVKVSDLVKFNIIGIEKYVLFIVVGFVYMVKSVNVVCF